VVRDCAVLFGYPIPLGIDGYYYLLQTRDLLDHGSLHFHYINSLAIYLFAAISIPIGNTVAGIKIGAIILHLALSVGIFSITLAVTKNYWLSLLGLVIAVFSSTHFYFIVEFLNQLAALTFLVWALFAIIRYSQTKRSYYLLLIFSMLTAALLSHRSALFLIVFIFIFSLLPLAQKSENVGLRIVVKIFLGSLFFTPPLLKLLIPGYMPEWVGFELLSFPRPPFSPIVKFDIYIALIFLFLTAVLLLAFPYLRFQRVERSILFCALLFIVFFNLNPFLNHFAGFLNITGRMDAITGVINALALPVSLGLWWKTAKVVTLITLPAVSVLIVCSSLQALPAGASETYMADRGELSSYLNTVKEDLCSHPIIIASHGDQFLVTATLGLPSQQTIPDGNREYGCFIWLLSTGENALGKDKYRLIEQQQLLNTISPLAPTAKSDLLQKNSHLSALIKK
jgi:hypothetical protein